jgi:glutaredoxin
MQRYIFLEKQKRPAKATERKVKRMNKAKKKQKQVVRRYLITMRGCEACKFAKERLRAKITSGEIKTLSVNNHKGVEILQALNVRAVPVLVQEFDDGTFRKEW